MIDYELNALRGRVPNIMGHETAAKFSVLLPLIEYKKETCILFEKRAASLSQPGEVCFPGGGMEENDKGRAMAAIRETCEELGLDPEDIELITSLDILTTNFNSIIYPYVGYIKDYSKIKPNPEEVEEIFYVPLKFLCQYKPIAQTLSLKYDFPDDYPYELIPHGKDYPYREGSYPQYFYIWKQHVIWGLTARIVNHFLGLVKSVSPPR